MPQDFFLLDPQQKPVAGMPLDLQHWATSALAIWPIWEGAGQQIEDIISGINSRLAGGISWQSGPSGPMLRSDGSNGSQIAIPGTTWMNLPFTFLFRIHAPSVANFSVACAAQGTDRWYVQRNGNDKLYFTYGASFVSGNTDVFNKDQWFSVALVATGSQLKIYVNGKLDAAATNSSVASATTNLYLFAKNSAGFCSCDIDFAAFLPYELTVDQVREFYERTFDMFVQKRFPLHERKSTVLRPRGPTWRNVNSIVPEDERPEVGTPINLESDLADGLYAYFPFWEAAGQQIEDATGTGRIGVFGYINNPSLQSFKWDNDGFYAISPSAFANAAFTLPFDFANDFGTSKIPDFSLVVRFDTGVGTTVFTHHTGTFGNGLKIAASYNSLTFTFTGNYSASFSGPAGMYTCVFVKQGANAYFYIDGKLQTTINLNLGSVIAGDNTQQKLLFTSGGPTPTQYQGIAFYTRALTQSEIERWSDANGGKWKVFRHRRRGSSTSLVPTKPIISSGRKRAFEPYERKLKPEAGTPLNIDHWASKAIAIWPMWEGAGGQAEDITGNGHTVTISNLSNGASFNGEGLVFGGGGGVKLSGIPNLTNWSWVAIINPLTQPNPYGNLITVSNNRGIWIHSNKIDFFNVADHLANTPLQLGIDQHVAVTCDSTGLAQFYYNGSNDGFAFTATNTYPFDSAGADGNTGIGEPYKGQMKLVMLFDFVLTPDQIKELYERPYEVFSHTSQWRLAKLPSSAAAALRRLLNPLNTVWKSFKGIFS